MPRRIGNENRSSTRWTALCGPTPTAPLLLAGVMGLVAAGCRGGLLLWFSMQPPTVIRV